ncbi:MAG: M24 family metallopeptidase [Streptosporangiaceae bacterium]
MPETHERRRQCLRALVRDRDADAALVTHPANVRYLTGFTGSNAALLVEAAGHAVLATDGRYVLQAADQAADAELVVDRKVAAALAERAAKDGVRRLAFEAHHVTVEAGDRLAEAGAGAELVRLGRAVEDLRMVKDADEIDKLRAACQITDRAFRHVMSTMKAGVTEREIARALEERFLEHGAEGPAFSTIVASGPHSAEPHHAPTDRQVSRGDLIAMDFGALYHGYHADMTRTVIVGEVRDWQRELYDLVADAQRGGRDALVPGADVRDVDEAARSVVRAAGLADNFPHGLGHGIGLEVHEQPYIGVSGTGKLQDAVSVTVEPGVYIPRRGGVRIEDTLVVRPDGPELLTTSTKELLVL